MSRAISDAFFLLLLFLLAIGIFLNGTSSTSKTSEVNQTIEEFDEAVREKETVNDGYLDQIDGVEEYEGNGMAKGVEKVGNIIVKGVGKVINIFLDGVRGLLD